MPRTISTYRYPQTHPEGAPFVLFTQHRASYGGIGNRTNSAVQATADIVLTEEGSVSLYMPMGVSVNDNMVYDTVSTGILGSAIANGVASFSEADLSSIMENPGQIPEALSDVVSRAGDDFAGIATGVGGAVTGATAAGIGGAFSSSSGITKMIGAALGGAAIGIGANTAFQEANKSLQASLNPREFMLFKAPGMRQFQLSFRFIPDSETEAAVVEQIIKWFRKGMYPEVSEYGFAYKFPNAFQIQFRNTRGIPRMPEMFLETASTTYNPNSMSYYEVNNRPVEVTLSLTFKELQPLNKDMIEEGF